MSADHDRGEGNNQSRAQAIARLLSDVRAAWETGRSVNEGAIVAMHPELMPDLGEQLRRLREQGAASRASDPAFGETIARPGGVSQNKSAAQEAKAGSESSTRGFVGADGFARAPVAMQVPGYSIQNEISRGGQAVVYLAVQLNTGRKVAIKVMREGPLADARQMARFQREVQILAALDHPNIVSIIDTGQAADGSLFISMPFIAGVSLDEYIQRQLKHGGDPSRMLRLFYKICLAIHEAHLKEIVHRDLKPSNIRVDERGEPHILDFGLARSGSAQYLSGTREAVSVTGEFLGSLPWSSPEQADGDPEKVDRQTDVYSLGVILYQMLTGGRFPYEVVGNIRDVLNNIVSIEPKPPSQVIAAMAAAQAQSHRGATPHKLPAVNEVMERVVLKALAKRKEMRYQTAGELGKDIARYLRGTMVQPAPSSSAGPSPGKKAAASRSRRWHASHTMAVAAIILCAGLGAMFWYVVRNKGNSVAAAGNRIVEPVAQSKNLPPPKVPKAPPRALPKAPVVQSNHNLVNKAEPRAWVPLLNGTDLTGWELSGVEHIDEWTVHNGVLEGRGGVKRANGRGGWGAIAYSELLADFDIRFDTTIAEGKSGAIQFVVPTEPGTRSADAVHSSHKISIKIFITQNGNDTQRTGNIMIDGLVRQVAKPLVMKSEKYCSMDIVRKQDTISVLVNGEVVSSYSDSHLNGEGYFLFNVNGETTILFKNVRIQQLDNAGKAGPANILSNAASAPTGGMSTSEMPSIVAKRPEDVIAMIPAQNLLPTDDADKIKSLTSIVMSTVEKGERIIRVAPDNNATNAQREELKDSKAKKLLAIVSEAAGATVNATITVVDVQQTAKMFARPGENYSVLGKYTVIGRIEWAAEPTFTDAERKQIAAINKESDAEVAQARKVLAETAAHASKFHRSSSSSTDFYQKKLNSIEETRKREIKAIRDNASARRPTHIAYLMSNDEKVLSWKRGDTRTLRGVVQSMRAFIYGPYSSRVQTMVDHEIASSSEGTRNSAVELAADKTEGLNIGVEAIIKVLPAPNVPAASNPAHSGGTTQPGMRIVR